MCDSWLVSKARVQVILKRVVDDTTDHQSIGCLAILSNFLTFILCYTQYKKKFLYKYVIYNI